MVYETKNRNYDFYGHIKKENETLKRCITIMLCALMLAVLGREAVSQATTSSKQIIINKQIEILKKKSIPNYKFYKAKAVYFTGADYPEIAVSSHGFEKGTSYIDKSMLQVYQYNVHTKIWKIINTFKDQNQIYSYRPLEFITTGKLIDQQKEQLVAGYVWGNDWALSPFVYGSTDGKTVKHLISTGDTSFTDGNVIIKGKELFFVDSLSIVRYRYTFQNGSFRQFKGTGTDDWRLTKEAAHRIYLDRRGNHTFFSGPTVLKLKVGESFGLVRQNRQDQTGYYLRIEGNNMYKGNILKNTNNGVIKAIKPGVVTFSIVLDYETMRTFRIEVSK